MTREEQLIFCKKCTNRKLDLQQGLLCSLTGEKAAFTNECPDFNLDETVKEVVIDVEPVEPQQIQEQLSPKAFEKLRIEQNFSGAVVAGSIIGIIGSAVWGAITVATRYQIGYMAIAIGAGVGLSMRYIGKGIDPIFGITGGIIAVLSCILGNFLSIIGFIADAEGLGYFETLGAIDFSLVLPIMVDTFAVMDLLFYGIAGYEGYKLAFRTLSNEELTEIE